MNTPLKCGEPDTLGRLAGAAGNVPGTESIGIIYQERVNVECKKDGEWSAIQRNVPALFEPVNLSGRISLEAWTHKPLMTVWLPPCIDVQDGYRLIRSDATRWYIRGTPVMAGSGACMVALAERAAEDGVFAQYQSGEPD